MAGREGGPSTGSGSALDAVAAAESCVDFRLEMSEGMSIFAEMLDAAVPRVRKAS